MNELVYKAAIKQQLNPKLITAIIAQESSNNCWAIRYEPLFQSKYLKGKSKEKLGGFFPPNVENSQELFLRACSFGLMQIMGQVARERGFEGTWLTELLDPEVNLYYGCLHFDRLLRKTDGNVTDALLAWNGGGDPNYPAKVEKHLGMSLACI
jgi:hypothetical protein